MGKRILLVDDEQELRETVKAVLSEDNHMVVEANNGAEAWRLFTQSRFDLVMTDFKLPFVMGDELATRIKRLAPKQPLLMITGYEQRPGPRNPVDAVLRKPLGSRLLRQTVAGLLDNLPMDCRS